MYVSSYCTIAFILRLTYVFEFREIHSTNNSLNTLNQYLDIKIIIHKGNIMLRSIPKFIFQRSNKRIIHFTLNMRGNDKKYVFITEKSNIYFLIISAFVFRVASLITITCNIYIFSINNKYLYNYLCHSSCEKCGICRNVVNFLVNNFNKLPFKIKM